MKNKLKFMKSVLFPRQVGYIILYITNRCNFRCKFCFYHEEIEKGRKFNELTVAEIEKIAKSTGALLQLSMTGGEPFLRDDFHEITHVFIKHTGVKFITIPTNGWLTDRIVNYLKIVLPKHPKTYFRLAFSVDGIGEMHDENRSMPGACNKIIETYNAVSPLRKQYSNLVLDTNTVFTSKTEDCIVDILKHLVENFEYDNHTVTFARGDVKDPALKSEAAEKYREMNAYLESLARKKEKRFMYPVYRGVRDVAWKNLMDTVFEDKFVTPCVAGRKMIVIGETGEVYPCEILNKTMGNLRDFDFDVKKLLASQQNKKLRSWIKKSKCKCSFECALAANVAWNVSQYPRIFKAAFKNIGKGWRNTERISSVLLEQYRENSIKDSEN